MVLAELGQEVVVPLLTQGVLAAAVLLITQAAHRELLDKVIVGATVRVARGITSAAAVAVLVLPDKAGYAETTLVMVVTVQHLLYQVLL